jgi:hypothetical protein
LEREAAGSPQKPTGCSHNQEDERGNEKTYQRDDRRAAA